MMRRRDWIFGLSEIYGIGEQSIEAVLRSVPNLDVLPLMDPRELQAIGLSPGRAMLIRKTLNESFIAKRYECYSRENIRIIVRGDEDYPKMLQEIAHAPIVLYAKGDVKLLSHPSIAVVGTRRATLYGRRATSELVNELCACGLGIVSGMARGIDTEAHLASLKAGAPSIAVLGTGLDVVYPRENEQLIERMASSGVLVTENPLGMPVKKGLFYLRNRIIAGLSLGTLVVEGHVKSGAWVTAEYATNNNRDVYVVPGSIFTEQGQGAVKWLREGARCVSSGIQIAEEYMHILARFGHTNKKTSEASPLTRDEQLVLSHMTKQGITFDELLLRTNFPFGHLHTVLLSLLVKKLIHKQTGSTYVSNH